MKSMGGKECVMKVLGSDKGFTGLAYMTTHHQNTRRRLVNTFALFKFWSVIG